MTTRETSRRRPEPAHAPDPLLTRFLRVRAASVALAAPLTIEDQVVQTVPDVSPTKWHLAHTSWFFETFLLRRHLAGYRPLDERYHTLFNSYYETVGAQHPRGERGMLSRPTVAEVHAYRAHVDAAVGELLARGDFPANVVELGLNHEQQHQELLLTDAKHVLAQSPLEVVYRARDVDGLQAPAPAEWRAFDAGLVEIGATGDAFAFDNERPRHQTYLNAFELASRPVGQAEYLAFIEDDGYRRVDLWLADGWERVQTKRWEAPLYWRRSYEGWRRFSLAGELPLEPALPVAHLSFFEADAYARWAGARLPTEAEWEHAATNSLDTPGAFLDDARFDPAPLPARAPLAANLSGKTFARFAGDVWEWTASPYAAYPGFRPLAGSLGEYNAKFMSSQMVCRGGSCATWREHTRPTYRNFFYPHQRWQFTGLRLARDV